MPLASWDDGPILGTVNVASIFTLVHLAHLYECTVHVQRNSNDDHTYMVNTESTQYRFRSGGNPARAEFRTAKGTYSTQRPHPLMDRLAQLRA
jgi:hypothetical protein